LTYFQLSEQRITASSMHSILSRTTFLLLISTLAPAHLSAQLSVKTYVQQISKGWTTDAKTALPDLLIDRPDDPAVMYLHATLVDEPDRAMPLFERIVQSHAQSEWADDALLRLIMHAVSKKEADKAKTYFKTMRDVYPNSDLLPVAFDLLRMTVGVPPATPTETSAPTTTAASTAASTAKTADAASGLYTLNTKVVSSKADAEKLLDAFQKKRIRARIAEKWVSGKRNYVVQVGEYDSEIDAAKDLDVVRGMCKCKPTIVRRD
jgi:hypothetical protein